MIAKEKFAVSSKPGPIENTLEGFIRLPLAMAHGMLSGLPIEYGIYFDLFGCIFFTLFSTRKIRVFRNQYHYIIGTKENTASHLFVSCNCINLDNAILSVQQKNRTRRFYQQNVVLETVLELLHIYIFSLEHYVEYLDGRNFFQLFIGITFYICTSN